MAIGPWLTFKLYPPIAFGALIAATTYLAKNVLKVSPRNLMAVALASSLYILNLRISWDYQRQLLGSVIMVLAIVVLESYRGRGAKCTLLASLLLVLTSMAHEVTGVVAFVLALLLLVEAVANRAGREIAVHFTALAVITALLLWYWRILYTPNMYLGAAPPGVVSYPVYTAAAGEVISYLVVGYGLVLPPALLVLTKPGYRYLKIAVVTLFLAGLSPLIAPYTAATAWYRFLIGAAPLMVPLAIAGLTTYGEGRATVIYVLLFAVVGIPFILQYLYMYDLVAALTEFPPGLTPSPAIRPFLQDLYELSTYISANISKADLETPIMAQRHVARWIHLGIRNPEPGRLIWIPYDPGISAVCNVMTNHNTTRIYIITTKDIEALVREINTTQIETCGPYSGEDIDVKVRLLRDGTYKLYLVEVSSKQAGSITT
ncbi:MAG: hypothetical protein QXP97_08075 [Desulfurococcus sp.]|uniref:hypothetical protein n=1 Tax=Desulfurococcus sp. TaxID=51678 RepID=UPI003164219C